MADAGGRLSREALRRFDPARVPSRCFVVDQVPLPHDIPAQFLFTVDVDGSDPSVFSATCTAVPSGPGWYQTLSLFQSVARQWRTVGFDLMEPAPILGFHGYHFAAAPLVYKLIGKRFP